MLLSIVLLPCARDSLAYRLVPLSICVCLIFVVWLLVLAKLVSPSANEMKPWKNAFSPGDMSSGPKETPWVALILWEGPKAISMPLF